MFDLRSRNTNTRTEIVAGASIFMTMSYIIFVQPALVAATPDIVFAALYGAVIGIAIYFVAKWMLMLTVWYGRRSRLNRKFSLLLR